MQGAAYHGCKLVLVSNRVDLTCHFFEAVDLLDGQHKCILRVDPAVESCVIAAALNPPTICD